MMGEHEHALWHKTIEVISELTLAIREGHVSNEIKATLNRVEKVITKMAKTQSELAADVKAATAQLQKISTESSATLQAVKDLQAIIDAGGGAGGTVTQELIDAVTELKAQVQVVDDLTPDAAPPPPPEP